MDVELLVTDLIDDGKACASWKSDKQLRSDSRDSSRALGHML